MSCIEGKGGGKDIQCIAQNNAICWSIIKYLFSMSITELCIVGKNIIGALKMQNNYRLIKLYFFQCCDSNIWLFSIAPFTVNAVFFSINTLLLFFIAISTVFALPTIAIFKREETAFGYHITINIFRKGFNFRFGAHKFIFALTDISSKKLHSTNWGSAFFASQLWKEI